MTDTQFIFQLADIADALSTEAFNKGPVKYSKKADGSLVTATE